MRISDWSSDVCSSDLEVAVDLHVVRLMLVQQAKPRIALAEIVKRQVPARLLQAAEHAQRSIPVGEFLGLRDLQAESVTIAAASVQALGNPLGHGHNPSEGLSEGKRGDRKGSYRGAPD